jgi:SAM-dependent methyltransferase
MQVPSNWWQNFFSGFIVDFWLQATPEEQTRKEADFIQEMLQVAPPARLLDVPCGGGRHSLALAARGHRMTAVDISPAFLEAAKAKDAAAAVTWERRDMRDLPWPGAFDGAFCFGNSFGYYEEDGNADFLKAVAGALKPGARFLLDASYITEVVLPNLQVRAWYPVGDVIVLADRHYDPARGRLYVEYICIRNGQMEKRAMSARIFSFREVCRLLDEAGFADYRAYGSVAKEPFRLGSERVLLGATKVS